VEFFLPAAGPNRESDAGEESPEMWSALDNAGIIW